MLPKSTTEKIELGKQVTTIVESGKVMYEAPGKIDKEAQTRSFVLHKWQEDVMKFSNSSTERQVIWITILGGETFFQKYVVGYRQCRAARLDLRVKHANAYNVLKKLSQSIYFLMFDPNPVKI